MAKPIAEPRGGDHQVGTPDEHCGTDGEQTLVTRACAHERDPSGYPGIRCVTRRPPGFLARRPGLLGDLLGGCGVHLSSSPLVNCPPTPAVPDTAIHRAAPLLSRSAATWRPSSSAAPSGPLALPRRAIPPSTATTRPSSRSTSIPLAYAPTGAAQPPCSVPSRVRSAVVAARLTGSSMAPSSATRPSLA